MNKDRVKFQLFGVLLVIILSIGSISCKKDGIPVLTTWDVLLITTNSAVSGGNIVDKGSSEIVSLGICWNTEPEPTIQDFKTSEVASQAQFSSTMRGLLTNTKYYVRAYAVNDEGIGYGNEISFTTK